MPNYNRETGVSYGVIACASLDDWIYDEIDQMDCPGEEEAYAEFMRDRAMELIDKNEIDYEDLDCEEGEESYGLAEMTDMQVTDLVDSIDPNAGQSFWDGIELGTFRRYGTIDGVRVSVAELGGALNLWVEESPNTGYCKRTSPCVPGAGDCDSPCDEDDRDAILCYVPPQDWLRKVDEKEQLA